MSLDAAPDAAALARGLSQTCLSPLPEGRIGHVIRPGRAEGFQQPVRQDAAPLDNTRAARLCYFFKRCQESGRKHLYSDPKN